MKNEWPSNATYPMKSRKPKRYLKNYPPNTKVEAIYGHEMCKEWFEDRAGKFGFTRFTFPREHPSTMYDGMYNDRWKNIRSKVAYYMIRLSGADGMDEYTMNAITGWGLKVCNDALRLGFNRENKSLWDYKFQFIDEHKGKYFDERGLQ